jgi:hypothetical protein
MKAFRSLNSWHRAARLATLVIVFAAGWVVVARARNTESALAQSAAVPPYALFQYSTLTGTGNTITAALLPVVTASGTIYQNVTIQFNVDASGNLTVAPGYPLVIPAPPPVVSQFLAGTYTGPSNILNGNAMVTVNGPGVTAGGTTVWMLHASPGADPCTYPTSITWYVGPIGTNPLAGRIKNAHIPTSNGNEFFGIAGPAPCSISENNWPDSALVGLSQSGKSLSIESFSTYNGTTVPTDHNSPVDEIPYTLP